MTLGGLITPASADTLPPEWSAVPDDVATWMEARDAEGAVFIGVADDGVPVALLITDLPDGGPMPTRSCDFGPVLVRPVDNYTM